jgi:hypothetical protein
MHHCGNFIPRALTRREMLARCANGFGAIALTALLSDKAFGEDRPRRTTHNSLVPRPTAFFARRRSMSSFSTWTAARRRWTPSIPSRG